MALVGGLLLLAPTLLLAPPAGLSVEGWRMAGVAGLMAAWWIGEALPIAATALMPLVLFPLLGILPSASVGREYGNHLIFLFLGGFMLAIAMERWQLHKRIALHTIARTGSSPPRLVLGFMLAVAFLSMWISNTATTLMILPIAMAVVKNVASGAALDGTADARAQRLAERSLGSTLMLAIAYSASAGGMATLIGTPPNIVLAGAVREIFPGLPEISFGRWMLLGLPIAAALLAAIYLVVLRLGPVLPLARFQFPESGPSLVRAELRAMGPMSRGEKKVLAGFLSAVFLWLTRSPLELGGLRVPGWAELFPHAGHLHDATVAMGVGIALMAVRARRESDGASVPLLDWSSVHAKTPWGILLLFGGGFALAAGFQSSGLANWIGTRLQGLQGLPLPVVIGIVCLSTTFLTEVTSNTATSTMLMPILAATATAIGAPPLLLMVPAALSASCAFMLPVATPPNAIVFGSEWVSVPRMARVGFVLNLLGAAVITLLSWLLVPRVLAAMSA